MIIVTGHLIVDAADRERQLKDAVTVMTLARKAKGCLDFAMSGDLLDPRRINILERWATKAELDAFRGSGPDAGQSAKILSGQVAEYDVTNEHPLFG